MKYDWSTGEAIGKTAAVLVGSSTVYLVFCVFCVTALPVSQDVALATGILAGFPVWIGSMCYAVLAKTTVRAWGAILTATVLIGSVAALAKFAL